MASGRWEVGQGAGTELERLNTDKEIFSSPTYFFLACHSFLVFVLHPILTKFSVSLFSSPFVFLNSANLFLLIPPLKRKENIPINGSILSGRPSGHLPSSSIRYFTPLHMYFFFFSTHHYHHLPPTNWLSARCQETSPLSLRTCPPLESLEGINIFVRVRSERVIFLHGNTRVYISGYQSLGHCSVSSPWWNP